MNSYWRQFSIKTVKIKDLKKAFKIIVIVLIEIIYKKLVVIINLLITMLFIYMVFSF